MNSCFFSILSAEKPAALKLGLPKFALFRLYAPMRKENPLLPRQTKAGSVMSVATGMIYAPRFFKALI